MRWMKALAAFAALLVLVAGTPTFLVAFIGNPWPAEGVSLGAPLTDNAVIGIFAVAAWLLWAQLVVCVVIETVNTVNDRHTEVQVAGVFGFQQQLAHALIASIAVAVVVPASTYVASDANAASAQPTPAAPEDNAAGDSRRASTGLRAEEPDDQPRTVTVQRRDTLWSLAEKHLGEGTRYRDIARLNEGKMMTDGSTFRASSDLLVPGWELTLPDDATNLDRDANYIVQKGDTLSEIAHHEVGDANAWPELFDASKKLDQPVPMTDPDLIYPGQKIDLPTDDAEPQATGRHGAARAGDEDTNPDSGTDSTSRPDHGPSMSPRAVDGDIPDQTRDSANASRAQPDQTEPGSTASPDETDPEMPGWVMPGLLGAGTLLAGSLLLALRQRRASQHRTRRPGRTIAVAKPKTAAVEKSVTVAGARTTTTVMLVDELVRRLAAALAASGEPLPKLAAVEVTDAAVAIHLKEISTPPNGPWAVSDDGLLWVAEKDVELDEIGPDQPDSPAPWPLLVTIGHDDRDSTWMLNIEDLNVAVTGDTVAAADFARFIAAEVACNPWSKHTALDVVGIAGEVAAMSPARIHVHDAPAGAAANAIAEAVHTIDRLAEHQVDTPTARGLQNDPDPWPSRLVILDRPESTDELDQLIRLVADHRGRTATGVMINGGEHPDGFEVHIDERRQLTIPAVNLTVTSVGLTSDEAHGCAALLAHADQHTDVAVSDMAGDQTWQTMATATGSLRDQYRTSRTAATLEHSASVLDDVDDAYTSTGATTSADLEALAPKITETVREQVTEADPDLDADLEAWHSDSCVRPRLSLLGPVGARTSGTALDRRKPFYTELFAYLATRPYGATTDEVATALDIAAARVRRDVNVLREWLGSNPATGETFIPDARHAPSAQQRGVGVYEVVDALVDADLFRRLRVRAESRGPDGIDDLVKALRLVTGRPFEKLRQGGWGWLLEGDRLDHHMVCAITDVAHIVVNDSLHTGDHDLARWAVGIATMAAPDEEVARLDLAAVLDAQGNHADAERIVREDVCNRTDDGEAPTELPERTELIIDARRWLRKQAI